MLSHFTAQPPLPNDPHRQGGCRNNWLDASHYAPPSPGNPRWIATSAVCLSKPGVSVTKVTYVSRKRAWKRLASYSLTFRQELSSRRELQYLCQCRRVMGKESTHYSLWGNQSVNNRELITGIMSGAIHQFP